MIRAAGLGAGMRAAVRIWVAPAPVDMRRSFDRPAEEVRAALGEDPLSGQLSVFRSRSGEAKVLQGDFARKGQGELCGRGCAEGQWSASAGCPF